MSERTSIGMEAEQPLPEHQSQGRKRPENFSERLMLSVGDKLVVTAMWQEQRFISDVQPLV